MTVIGLSQPRALVFDLDDTLYPQIAFKRSGFRAVGSWLEKRGHVTGAAAEKVLEDILQLHGPSYPRMFDLLVDRLGLDGVDVTDLVTVFRRHRPDIQPYREVLPMLHGLREEMSLGLLTDGLEAVQRSKVIALGLEPLFDCIVYSDAVNSCKPDEALFRAFERAFGLSGAELVYVGDNPAKDFLGARSRGWLTVRILHGEHAHVAPPTLAYAADLDIGRVTELPAVLDALRGDREPTRLSSRDPV